MHFFQFSKTVLSFTNSKKCVSVTSLIYTDDDNKENIEPKSTPPRLNTPPRLSPITMTPVRGRSVNLSRRIVSTPARMLLGNSQQAGNGEEVERNGSAVGGGEEASPPSALRKAMRRISKGALEMAYAAIHTADTKRVVLQPTSAEEPVVTVYEPADRSDGSNEQEDHENMSPVSIGSLKMPGLMRTKTSPAKLSSPDPQMQSPMLLLEEPATPTPPQRSLTMPRVRPHRTTTAPDALKTALDSVSQSSVRSAYAALRRGDSFKTSLSVDVISTLQPQPIKPQQEDQQQLPAQIDGNNEKKGNGKPVFRSNTNNSSRATIATIAARRAFVRKPIVSKRRNQTTANITYIPRIQFDASNRLRKPNPAILKPQMTSASHITFSMDDEPRGRTRDRRDNVSAHAWWTSAQSSYASTPNTSVPPSILDFSPERPKGARGKIRRLLKKLVGKLRKSKGNRRKLEKKHGRKGEEMQRGFLGRYTVSRTVSREFGNA